MWKKSKWMTLSKDRSVHIQGDFTVGNIIDRVTTYKYHDCWLKRNLDNNQKIRWKIEKASQAGINEDEKGTDHRWYKHSTSMLRM